MKNTHPISLNQIQVTDAFWKSKMTLVRTQVIPYQWEALNDRIVGAAPSYCIRNFKLAKQILDQRKSLGPKYIEKVFPTNLIETLPEKNQGLEDRFYGFLFQDSDLYKWLEAVAYSLTQFKDPELEALADNAIQLICDAQQENGYLNTFYTINDPEKCFSNLASNHELYCFGHLIEAAVAYFQATGKASLLYATEKYAQHIITLFGEEEGKLKGYPGHEIAEMALVRLFEVTGNNAYLQLGKFFIDERGKRPYYFDLEFGKEDDLLSQRYSYQQAHLPVREQEEAVGHAVRAVYLYSGMASISRLTNDVTLQEASRRLWDNITLKKMYITGGIGATHVGEAFSYAYDLPNDSAYAETCAGIGLFFFGSRMLELEIDSRYGDTMERVLYNGILSGMAEDGKCFFYTNVLSFNPLACQTDQRLSHVKEQRQKWFGCACCPPNIARLITSLASYAFSETADTLFIHLYIGSMIKTNLANQSVEVQMDSAYPWDEKITLTIKNPTSATFTVALRIPKWCENYTLDISQDSLAQKIDKGYLYLTKNWAEEETITLTLPLVPKRVRSNPLVEENIGKAALMCGPIVYCLEEVDNGNQLHLLSLPKSAPLTYDKGDVEANIMPKIFTTGDKLIPWEPHTSLYFTDEIDEVSQVPLVFVPYHSWANRGIGEMNVWIREK